MKCICEKCGSDNVKVIKEMYNKKYEYERGAFPGDCSITSNMLFKKLVSYDVRMKCKCDDCGYEEYMG